MARLEELHQNLPKIKEKIHNSPQAGEPVGGPKFKPGTARIKKIVILREADFRSHMNFMLDVVHYFT